MKVGDDEIVKVVAKAGSAIIKLGDYERPALVAEILERNLRGWHRERWQALADRLRPPF